MVLEILFLIYSRVNVMFAKPEFVWRTYTAVKVFLITKKMEIIDEREFAEAVLNPENETFVIHIVALAELITIWMYPSYQAKITSLTSKEIGIPAEYSDFSNVFSSNSAAELLEYPGINNYSINLLDNKQPLYVLIYSLGSVELETLKTYIKDNLASSFIRHSKSPAGTPIIFI